MAKQTVFIGGSPNDGTGDPIRDAFNKVNQNFDEVYSSYTATGAISIGNTSVNSVVSNTGGFVTSTNTTVNTSTVANTTVIRIGNTAANATVNSTQISIFGNSSLGNATINTISINLGNSSVNSSLTQNTLSINASAVIGGVLANSTTVYLGNATVNWTANSSRISIREANVTTNTFSLGSSSVGSSNFANGYTRLPNGLLYQYGFIAAVNSTANVTTFSAVGGVAFTNLFSASASSNTVNTYVAIVGANSTAIILQGNNGTISTGVYWTAIGK